MSCRGRLAALNEKLTALERRIEYLEAKVSKESCLIDSYSLTVRLSAKGNQLKIPLSSKI